MFFIHLNTSNIGLELDGEFISKCSSMQMIRNKQLRIVFSEHVLVEKAPLIIFIHGFGGQVSQWRAQIEYFSPMCNILAVDLIGHGSSEVTNRGEDYQLNSIAQDLLEILKIYEANHKGNMFLVTHSFGTIVGVKLVEMLPDYFRGLVLLAPVSTLATKKNWITHIPTSGLDIIRWFDRLGGIDSTSVNRVVHSTASDGIRQSQLKWNSTSHSLTVQLMLSSSATIDFPSYHKLENIRLLIISGDSDTLSPTQLPYDIHRLARPASYTSGGLDLPSGFHEVVQNCGHNPMIEKPDIVNSMLEAFFSNVFNKPLSHFCSKGEH
ncbi:hypothetical protein DSO57_1017443 [Entomophthora muscae]|uniref:Uncharacterized protein n=2 Tax=Entomophthora muscae TaxID=34485 RepID=A0ACC2UQ98_9FUNG|nr:hypothetical protein DSO57_1017443 [Entomophthora muscae]